MPDDQTSRWKPPPNLEQFRTQRDKLVEQLERQSDLGIINVDEMIRLYSHEYDQPVLALIQDIQTQMAVYANVIEDLKRNEKIDDSSVTALKQHYRALGLIPEANEWPNPAADWLMNKALSKLREYWRALVGIMGRGRRKLFDELNLEPTMAIGFQMSISLNPSFTITVQPEITAVVRG